MPWAARPPGVTPTMTELAEQVDVLTKALEANNLPTTLAALQRKLEQGWQPDAGVLLQAGSVTPESLSVLVPTLTSGAAKLTPKRTLVGATMPVGINAVALDLTGVTAGGSIVTSFNPATHNTWSWYPYPSGVIFNNTGVSQLVTITYHVIGT